MRTRVRRLVFPAVLSLLMLIVTGATLAWAQDANDLSTKLPPPPPDIPSAPTSESDVDNGDGTRTYTQVITAASTSPHYVPPGNGGGFNVYSYFNQDYGWRHDFPAWNVAGLQVLDARLTIVAWDIDSEPSWGYDGEYDGVHVDGALLDPGYLQGNNNMWSTTVFAVQRSAIVDDGLINVWLDIDMHHNTQTWATTLDRCVLEITYAAGDPNNQPYEPDLVIYPECPGDNDDLIVAVTGPSPADPNGDDVHYEYRWFVNVGTGQYIDDEFAGRGNHTGNTVPAYDTVVGDLWRVQVLPVDSNNQRGDYSTASWTAAIGCQAAALQVVDGNPRYLNGIQLGSQSFDPELIAVAGPLRDRVAADGCSKLLIRWSLPGPGQAVLSLDANGGPAGTVTNLNGAATQTVTAVLTSHGYKAFWIYTPPESIDYPMSSLSPSASRRMDLEATFAPDAGTFNLAATQSFRLARPPLALVHGIWSSPTECWSNLDEWKDAANDLGVYLGVIDYSASTQNSFDFNYGILMRKCGDLIDYCRTQGLACSQVDVVAHSMGGDLARRWAQEPTFANSGNFYKGAINTLVTVDTPHQGSPLARAYRDLVIMAIFDLRARLCVLGLLANGMYFGPGVMDLIPGSDALEDFGITLIPTHAIFGAGGTSDFGNATGVEKKLDNRLLRPYLSTSMFGSEEHDYIVTASSQKGGLGSTFLTRQVGPAGEHTVAPGASSTLSRAIGLIGAGAASGEFSSQIPANQGTAIALMSSATMDGGREDLFSMGAGAPLATCGSIRYPSNGATLRPGTEVPLEVDLSGMTADAIMFVWDGANIAELDSVSGAGVLAVVDADCGRRTGHALILTTDGTICRTPDLTVNVVPEASVTRIDVLNSLVLLAGPGYEENMIVGGRYSDGAYRPSASSAVGTTYTVADPLIASVDPDGRIRALRPGSTTVAVRNGTSEATVQVEVLYAVANALPIVTVASGIEACLGDTITLDASGTYDPDARPGEFLAYSWDLDGDDVFDDAFGEQPRVVVAIAGDHELRLEVRDVSGGVVVASALLHAEFCGAIIDDTEPKPPVHGSPVRIIGRFFGNDPGEGARSSDVHNVAFAGQRVPDIDVLEWTDGAITVKLPAGIFSGEIVVTVERLPSNAFAFEFPNVAPVADAGPDMSYECSSPDGALVSLDGSASSDRDGDALSYTWSLGGAVLAGPGAEPTAVCTLGRGVHEVVLTVDDGISGADTDTVQITVADTTAPTIAVEASLGVLWPPNHKMVEIAFTVTLADGCDSGPTWQLMDVLCNEPDDGTGDGDLANDIQGAEPGTADAMIRVRAERSGTGNGRVYRAVFRAQDESGNAGFAYAEVCVPHDVSRSGGVLGSPGAGSSPSAGVVYMVGGRGLWGNRLPVRIDEGAGLMTERVEALEPRSAAICNTAGSVTASAFYLEDVDGDRVRDVVASFDRMDLLTLRSISTEDDGDPVFAIELLDDRYVLVEMSEILEAPLDLEKLLASLEAAATSGGPADELDQARDVPALPAENGLSVASPNPFNPATTITYSLRADAHVRLSVFDLTGRRIASLVDETRPAGVHQVIWTGIDAHGDRVASGVYLYRMEAGTFRATGRMLLLK